MKASSAYIPGIIVLEPRVFADERGFLGHPLNEYPRVSGFIFLLFIAVLVGFTALAYASHDDSIAAYDRGDYVKAYKELKPLAEQGDGDAKLYLGLMC